MSDLVQRIRQRLDTEFAFKTRGSFLRDGKCPACSDKSLWAYAENPRVVYCNRINKCGYSANVRELFDDLFKHWSADHPQTAEQPHAAADAYLREDRGFDLAPLQGHYSQEIYTDRTKNISSATVRFPLTTSSNDYWQRLIDRPERFGKDKARFNYGAKTEGQWWVYPHLNLASLEELWITEGIFDAIALNQNGIPAVSAMSSNNYPNIGLEQLKADCEADGKAIPHLVWAFDNDKAGLKGLAENHERAISDGWISSAALPPTRHMGNLDWNDLHQRGQLSPDYLKRYRHFGQLQLAKNAAEAGLLIYNHYEGRMRTFDFVYKSRMYWFELDLDKYNKAIDSLRESYPDRTEEDHRQQALLNNSGIKEICNAKIKPLYFQRDVAADESAFYYRIESEWGTQNITFTPDQLSSRSKFKPRIMSAGSGVMWIGSDDLLERIVKRQNEGIREVKTIDFIGYAKEHQTYIFSKYAIHKGQIIPINEYDYFKIGRHELKTLALQPEIQINPKQTFDPSWYKKLWITKGVKGLIALAWWTGSYFAEQIRAIDKSYPFIELVGEPGAGKSGLIEFFWRLSGREDYEGFDANKGTPVGIYRNLSQVANLPVVLIEGDRNDEGGGKPKISFDEFKDAFNGRPVRSMGRKNNGNDTREPLFRAALMFSQNSDINAHEAILTRTLYLNFDRAGQTLATKEMADDLLRLSIEQSCTYMTHCLKNEAKILETYRQKVNEYQREYHLEEINHTRIALCHAQVAALLDAIATHVFQDYIDLDHLVDTHKYLKHIARQRLTKLSGDHPDVEKFWDVYDYMHNGRNIAINHHPDNAPTVAINLNEFYKWASELRQSLPEINIMKQLLVVSKTYKFREKNRNVNSPHRKGVDMNPTIKCWIFDKPQGKSL